VIDILSYFCCKPVENIQELISKEHLAEAVDIPDIILDIPILEYKKYFTNEAWTMICQISKYI